jgi:hypothetical protein
VQSLVYDTRNHLPSVPPAGWSIPMELVITMPGLYAVLVDGWLATFQMSDGDRAITVSIGNPDGVSRAPDERVDAILRHVRACSAFQELTAPPGVETQGKRMFRAKAAPGDAATWPTKLLREGDVAPPAAAVNETQLRAMLWTQVEAWRREGKSLDGVFLVVFDVGSSPGFELYTRLTAVDDRTSVAEAERKARSALAGAAGGRVQFQVMQTLDALRAFLQRADLDAEFGPKADAAAATLPAKPPAGKFRVLVFCEGAVDARLVDIRRPEVPSPSIHRTDAEVRRDAVQSLLVRCEKTIFGLYQDRLRSGRAARNLAILVEQLQTGEVDATVELRTAIAALIEKHGPAAGEIAEMLKKPALEGNLHCVVVMWREGNVANLGCMQVKVQ